MRTTKTDKIESFWNKNADDWDIQVGEKGDDNRRLNSDPVLWRFAGKVKNLRVLDAGCGTGYLSGKLLKKGSRVIGVDISEKMVKIAEKNHPGIDFRVDSCSKLSTVKPKSFDLVIANYVLMDTPELQSTIDSFHRVLKPGGQAVLIFSHSCFPQGRIKVSKRDKGISYRWKLPYFKQFRQIELPWGHFKNEFIWFHRPLSDYWKAFLKAGFKVVDFEEPRIEPDKYHLVKDKEKLTRWQNRPYSVAFKLEKEKNRKD